MSCIVLLQQWNAMILINHENLIKKQLSEDAQSIAIKNVENFVKIALINVVDQLEMETYYNNYVFKLSHFKYQTIVG